MDGTTDITPYGNPVNAGTSTDFVQWENSHVSSRFPFGDDEPMAALNGKILPVDFLVDLSVFTDSDPGSVRLSSAYIGPGMVSMSLSDSNGPLCMCSVPLSEYEQYRPFVMDAFPGRNAAGVCSFGVPESAFGEPTAFKFSRGPKLASSACCRIDMGRIVKFVDPKSGESVSGDVVLSIGAGLVTALGGVEDAVSMDTYTWPAGYIYMDSSTRDSLVSPCVKSSEDNVLSEVPVMSINGVAPTCDGKIAILFE